MSNREPRVSPRRAFLLASLVLFGLLSEARAQAPPVCLPRKALIAQLAQSFDENPRAVGLADSGNVLEIVRTDDGRTWTLLSTDPAGRSCVLATGRWWIEVPGDPLGLESGWRP